MRFSKLSLLALGAVVPAVNAQDSSLPSCASSTPEAEGLIGTLINCVTKCTSAATKINTCNGLKSCVCGLVDDVSNDVGACLLCGSFYSSLNSIVDGVVGEFLLGCDYTHQQLPLCPASSSAETSSSQAPSTSSSVASSSSAEPSGPASAPPPPENAPSTTSEEGKTSTVVCTNCPSESSSTPAASSGPASTPAESSGPASSAEQPPASTPAGPSTPSGPDSTIFETVTGSSPAPGPSSPASVPAASSGPASEPAPAPAPVTSVIVETHTYTSGGVQQTTYQTITQVETATVPPPGPAPTQAAPSNGTVPQAPAGTEPSQVNSGSRFTIGSSIVALVGAIAFLM